MIGDRPRSPVLDAQDTCLFSYPDFNGQFWDIFGRLGQVPARRFVLGAVLVFEPSR